MPDPAGNPFRIGEHVSGYHFADREEETARIRAAMLSASSLLVYGPRRMGKSSTIANAAEAFPLVFQHGDPGTWNAMVAPSGRTAFLDWEAAESQGMPLWDLFYFVRTYGAWSLGSAVSGDVTKGFASQFLGDTPFQALLAEAAARYCDRVGVPQQYVEPLFYTCWMHRALKEATRLSAGALDRGHYVNVLRASDDRREALQKLFAAPVAS